LNSVKNTYCKNTLKIPKEKSEAVNLRYQRGNQKP